MDSSLKILSGLVLCYCLVKVAQLNLSSETAVKILSTLAVSYDESQTSCPEFQIVKDALPNPR